MNLDALTMYPDTIIASTQLNPLLRTFAENVWEKVNQNLDSKRFSKCRPNLLECRRRLNWEKNE